MLVSLSMISFAQTFKLDSVVNIIRGKKFIESQKFDSKTNKAELIRYECDSASTDVVKTQRFQVAYDNNENERITLASEWNPVTNIWDEVEKTEREFNSDNQEIKVIHFQKINNMWVKESENTHSYVKDTIIESDYEVRNGKFQEIFKTISYVNKYDKIVRQDISIWDDDEQGLKLYQHSLNQFLNDTVLTISESFRWNKDQWQKDQKVEYQLDSNGVAGSNYILYESKENDWIPTDKFTHINLPIENKQIRQNNSWDKTKKAWVEGNKIVHFFDNKGNDVGDLYFELDKDNGQFILTFERIKLYNSQGLLTLIQSFEHNNEGTKGNQISRKIDENGNVIREDTYFFDVESDKWKEQSSTIFVYAEDIVYRAGGKLNENIDLFNLSSNNLKNNKNALKHVMVFEYKDGIKILEEQFDYFYSISK